ncbi:MAG: alpha/beta hydrolase [Myxococcota bacterium]|nr:alpha/beta hydrolase [Myxococcota bacterium]
MDEQGTCVWAEARHALRWASPSLQLPGVWTADGQNRDSYRADGALRSILWATIYRPILDWGTSQKRPFYVFAYDWRRSNMETMRILQEFLRSLKQKHGVSPQVIAHSMGGMLIYAALHDDPTLAQSVIAAGTPFGAGLGLLESIHLGSPLGLNRTILDVKTLGYMTSVYSFFPATASRLHMADGTEIQHNWYSIEDWEQQRLGMFSLSLDEKERHLYREHLTRALPEARQFRDRVDAPPSDPSTWPPFGLITATQFKTIFSVARDPTRKGGWNFTSREMFPGDGTVMYEYMFPQLWVERNWRLKLRHRYLLNSVSHTAKAIETMAAL